MAMGASLRLHTSLAAAVEAMGFVQYDPIRRPTCAQDLILHQRVRGYRGGALSRDYPRLGLEEGYLHVYGAMTPRLAALVRREREYTPRGLAADVFALVRERGPLLPRDVSAELGRARTANDWGGISTATTRALEELHQHWLVRVAYRSNGVKAYEVCPPRTETPQPEERNRRLTLHMARSLAPISDSSLRSTLAQLQRASGIVIDRGPVIKDLLDSGELESETVDGIRYLWPGELHANASRVTSRVRFLAPFDPVVWDRRRFAHLWGWAYRFEAYTPAAKRQFGYYALPMFWADKAIGWVNCDPKNGWALTTTFIEAAPAGTTFRRAFEQEVTRLAEMLGTNVRPR